MDISVIVIVAALILWYGWPRPSRYVAPPVSVDWFKRPISQPLIYSIRTNDIAEVRRILDAGIDPNSCVRDSGGEGTFALELASSLNEVEIVQLLLDHGADVNEEGIWDGPSLLSAAHGGNPQVVQLLLDHGANVDYGDDMGGTALFIAVGSIFHRQCWTDFRNRLAVVSKLRSAGARRFMSFSF